MDKDVVIKIGADVTGLNKGLKSAGNSIQGFSDKVAHRMKVAGTALVGASVAIGAVSLKMAGDFDGAMREVNTMMQLSEDEFKGFSKEVQGLAKELGVNAVDSANALYQAISAGIPKENAIDFLKVATKAAIGGVTDTTTAVDGLTTVLNAFKMPVSDAQKVADVMFTTVKGGKTTFEELSASLFNVAPIAAASGIKFETVAAALATMTKQGVPTSQATTQLRQAMVALSRPTAEMKDALEKLGYASGQAMVEELGFAGSLNTLRDATEGNNEQLMKMFGSVEAGQSVLALTGQNAQTFQDDLNAMGDAAGAATEAFDQMEKTTGRKFEKIKSQLADMGITIGTALMPALERLLEVIGPIIEKIGTWISEHPKLTTALLAGALVLGGLLIALPKIIAFVGILKGATVLATAAQWIWNAAMSANPIGLIVLAIAGLVAGIVALVRHFDTVKGAFQAVGNFIKGVIDAIVGFFKNMVSNIKAVFWKIVDIVLTPFRLIVSALNKLPGINIPEIPSFSKKYGEEEAKQEQKETFGKITAKMEAAAMQEGGIVTGPTLALLGENRRKEAVIPLNEAGGLGTTVNVTVYGSVATERELADVIYDQLVTKKRHNAVLGLA